VARDDPGPAAPPRTRKDASTEEKTGVWHAAHSHSARKRTRAHVVVHKRTPHERTLLAHAHWRTWMHVSAHRAQAHAHVGRARSSASWGGGGGSGGPAGPGGAQRARGEAGGGGGRGAGGGGGGEGNCWHACPWAGIRIHTAHTDSHVGTIGAARCTQPHSHTLHTDTSHMAAGWQARTRGAGEGTWGGGGEGGGIRGEEITAAGGKSNQGGTGWE